MHHVAMANTNDNHVVAREGGRARGGGGRQCSKSCWTDVERAQFEQGVIVHGWGNWIAMALRDIPTRDRCQVKSHAQKFRKNHAADYQRLLREHAARRVDSPAVAVGSGKGNDGGVDTEERRKTPPRRRATTIKAKTQVIRTSPRSSNRFSASVNIGLQSGAAKGGSKRRGILRSNGNVVGTSAMKAATANGSPKKKIAKMQPPSFPGQVLSEISNDRGIATFDVAAPASTSSKSFDIFATAKKPMPPRLVGVLSDATNDVCHATFDRFAPASTLATFLDVKFPDRQHQAFEASTREYPPKYDELPALATTVSPFSGPMPAYCKSSHDVPASLSAVDINIHNDHGRVSTDEFGEYTSLATATKDVIGRAGNEEIIDPLYQLEMDDNRLDMIEDFLEPSCNVMFDEAIKGGMLSQGGDSRDPFATASNNGIGLVEWAMTSGRSVTFQIPPNVRPDPQLFMHIRSLLTSPPDVNNPEEYILGCVGMCRGSMCRVRIKTKLGEHLNTCWWREDVFANQSGVIQSALGAFGEAVEGGMDVRIGDVQNGNVSFKKLALERLVALIAVMLDVDHWHSPRDGTPLTATATTIADEEDDIRHVGQLLSGLWERVSRSLHRDGFALLGGDILERTERNEAINMLVSRLDLISRQEHIKSSRLSL